MFRIDPLANPEALIRRVYAYAAYRLGDGPDAEDATSETFERALRYRRSFDSSKGEPIAWLLGIARRCIDDVYARRQEATAETPDAASPGDLEADTELRMELAAAIGILSPRERELVALRYGADLTARQIARIVDMKPNAVEVALHRALGRLEVALAQPPPPPGGAPGPAHETKPART